MHLPIILVGLLAGPYAGLVSGALGPLCSFALSDMPGLVMLPFMMIELAVYAFGNESIRIASIWNSVVTGLPGLLLQRSLLPLIVFWVSASPATRPLRTYQ